MDLIKTKTKATGNKVVQKYYPFTNFFNVKIVPKCKPSWKGNRCAKFQIMLLLKPAGTWFNCSIPKSSVNVIKNLRAFLFFRIADI